jgi:hypothetical protein
MQLDGVSQYLEDMTLLGLMPKVPYWENVGDIESIQRNGNRAAAVINPYVTNFL